MSSPAAIEFGAFNPRRNLPAAVARKRGEANFVGSFHRTFAAVCEGKGGGGRHFELAGYGIADFVWMDFARDGTRKNDRAPLLTAFEMKLKDWRRALSQAYRYSYFSDRAIVVLPTDVANRAAVHLDTFRRLGIGLWGYEPKTERLDMRFTPTDTKAKSPAAREKAVGRISAKIELSQRRK